MSFFMMFSESESLLLKITDYLSPGYMIDYVKSPEQVSPHSLVERLTLEAKLLEVRDSFRCLSLLAVLKRFATVLCVRDRLVHQSPYGPFGSAPHKAPPQDSLVQLTSSELTEAMKLGAELTTHLARLYREFVREN